jgi:antitoxin YqcF
VDPLCGHANYVSSVGESARAAARAAAAAFGGTPQVSTYYDRDETSSVDILACKDETALDFVRYSTLGLHMLTNMVDEDDIRIEMAAVARHDVVEFPNLLATAAFYFIKNRWQCAPGVVYRSLLNEYGLSPTLEHVMWVEPFEWDQLGSVDVGGGVTIHWLLAIPISEAERRFLVDRGLDELEKIFIDREIEYFDLNRQSLV